MDPLKLESKNTSGDTWRKFLARLKNHLTSTSSKVKCKRDQSSTPSDYQKDVRVDSPLHRRRSRKQRFLDGWRAGATFSCIVALVVLLVNMATLIWAASRYPSDKGIGTIFSGHCAKVKSMNSWLQLIVNVLSSALLAASNYCMQCLSSPTRKEVDTAHAKGQLLDVGIPSIQNLKAISWERRILWAGLALSALPLHFV